MRFMLMISDNPDTRELFTGPEGKDLMAEVEAVVIENNVAEFVLGKAKVTEKVLPFDELMSA